MNSAQLSVLSDLLCSFEEWLRAYAFEHGEVEFLDEDRAVSEYVERITQAFPGLAWDATERKFKHA
jgi:hypothetical protein